MVRKKVIDHGVKATRVENIERQGVLHHRMICPYCRKNLIFRVDSHYYPKGPTMKCPDCGRVFKKFERPLKK